MHVLVTGAAGFIGCHCCRRLLAAGHRVTGVDSFTPYYDVALKEARLAAIGSDPAFRFERLDLAEREASAALFAAGGFDRVLHLAAQAGVRYSIDHPHAYAEANLVAFLNVLEGCRAARPGHLVYASSSSVYGLNRSRPYRVGDTVDHPVSLYAATKKANELMAHTYSHLYGLPTSGLRFFTVYGPWGRPDMAYWSFTRRILAGEPITLYNHGRMERDFTYVDDVVEAIVRLLDHVPTGDPAWDGASPDPASSPAPYRVYNIGNSDPVPLERFVEAIEAACGVRAERRYADLQPGDVLATAADCTALEAAVGFRPQTGIEDGIARFVAWYRDYHEESP